MYLLYSIMATVVLACSPTEPIIPPFYGNDDPSADDVYEDALGAKYEKQEYKGFTLLLHEALNADIPLKEKTVQRLERDIDEICELIKPEQLEVMKKVKIWTFVAAIYGNNTAAAYHPSEVWLTNNGYPKDFAMSIEIGNARRYADNESIKYVILHELAHGYHHLALGYDDAEVQACYDAAKASGKYDRVWNNITNRYDSPSYAIKNPQEYFAKATESYLAESELYPHVRAELETVDPKGYALMKKIWE